MHVGDQAVPLTRQALQFRARHGCYHIDSDLGGRDAALELDEQVSVRCSRQGAFAQNHVRIVVLE